MFSISKSTTRFTGASRHLSRQYAVQARTIGALSDRIKRDHQELREYADNIRNARDQNTKAEWQNQLTWELARHAIAEELVVYPALKKYLGVEGKQRADEDRAAHQSVR